MTATLPPAVHVLLVDDEEAIRDNLGAFLRRSGFRVSTAGDGRQALTAVESQHPDVVVLDVVMPNVDGREVLRAVRSKGNWVPVVLLTQVGESFERAAALEEGADDYLNKPFDPQELVARIRAILRREAQGGQAFSASSILELGDVRIDRGARRLWVAGREAMVTPKAFALLDYLATHPDEVISRDRLLAQVWGYDFPVSSRAVDHRVVEVRRALDDSTEPQWIETVPGVGYRFLARMRSL